MSLTVVLLIAALTAVGTAGCALVLAGLAAIFTHRRVSRLADQLGALTRINQDLRQANALPRRAVEHELERWADLTTPRTDWDAELRDLNRET